VGVATADEFSPYEFAYYTGTMNKHRAENCLPPVCPHRSGKYEDQNLAK